MVECSYWWFGAACGVATAVGFVFGIAALAFFLAMAGEEKDEK